MAKEILHKFGVAYRYKGSKYIDMAISIIKQDSSNLEFITKTIYHPIAKEYGCTVGSIERNIRTVIKKIWDTKPRALQSVAGYRMEEMPTVSEFLEILYHYKLRLEDEKTGA